MHKIPFYKPHILQEDIKAVSKVLARPYLTSGKHVISFEHRLAEFTQNKFCSAVMSCTHALELSLRCFNIQNGDEVITSSMTYIATVNAIMHTGAHPVLVDVDRNTGNIDIAKIKNAITAKTKAIIVVHLYGVMVNMKKLKKIAKDYNLILIEDAAHCIEGSVNGTKPGNFSDAACLSFYATKNITSGEGGAVLTNSEESLKTIKRLSFQGTDKNLQEERELSPSYPDAIKILGYKANMSNIQAALLNSQLKRIDRQWKIRNRIAEKYDNAFSENKDIRLPVIPPNVIPARHLYTIMVDPLKRGAIVRYLKNKGIETKIHYLPIHFYSFYKKNLACSKADFPVAENIGRSTITLPLYCGLKKGEIEHIIQSVIKAVKK